MANDIPLLVPIHIDALVVNALLASQVPFERWTNSWGNLNNFIDPIPPPWGSVGNPSLGVYLHWQLPNALTHGKAPKGSTDAVFPYTPNRWIVVRLASPSQGTAAQTMTAWIIESDYYDPNTGSTPYVDPASTASNLKVTLLGHSMPVSQWNGELMQDAPPFLTATGIAQATFLGYQPGLLDVYSFYDDTSALPENTVCTYLVAGWYANNAYDPLVLEPAYDPQRNLFTDLNWLILGESGDQIQPNRSVFHGLVNGLIWQTASVPARTDSNALSMQVAVAYSSIDALSAVLAQSDQGTAPTPEQLEMMLAAFGYDALHLLDEPDATAQLELLIRQAWFGSSPGGTLWQIVPVAQGQSSADPLSRVVQAAPAPLTPAQAKWLAAINTLQRAYDIARRELTTLQTELFSLWWKLQYASNNGLAPNGLNQWGINAQNLIIALYNQTQAGDSTFYGYVAAQQAAAAAQQTQVPDPASQISIDWWSQQIPDNKGNLTLRPSAMPAFQQPVDPVLLIAGITPPIVPDTSDPLPCRLATAATTGDNVVIGGKAVPVNSSTGSLGGIIQQPGTLPTANGQPLSRVVDPAIAAALEALAVEAFFADPNNATSITSNGLSNTDGAVIQALETAITNGAAEIATIANPLQASFAFAVWQQAWTPLYLEWNLQFYPTVQTSFTGQALPVSSQLAQGAQPVQDNLPMNLGGWSFNGGDNVFERGSEYYTWSGGDIWTPNPWLKPQLFLGRSSLTPNAETLFVSRLVEFINSQPVASGTAIVTGAVVTSVIVVNGGSGYSAAPVVTFSGGTGSGAAAIATIADGAITSITVTSGGSGYTTPPQVSITPGDWVAIRNLIDSIGETRFLSQTLSGFNNNLIMMQGMHTLPPDTGTADLVEGQARLVPNPALGNVPIKFGQGQPFFFPARGGFFYFNQLQIVDGFGQVLNLLQANGNSSGLAANFQAILGAGLTPDSSIVSQTYQINQAPRIVQPSRVNLRWLDSFDDSKEVFLNAGANPVCGWLIPNHLDHAIAVYNAAGEAMGELLVLMQTGGSEAVRWLPAPDSPGSVPDPSQIPNPHLRGAILAFTALEGGIPVVERVTAFRAWFNSIDETLWTVDPPGGQTDNDLAVLIGRPLAVVRMQVSTELYGRPAYNQSWRDTFDLANVNDPNSVEVGQQEAGFTALPFSIKLGSTELLSDGTIGYFVLNTYTTFNSVHAAKPASPYVQPIGGTNYLSLPFSYPSTSMQILTALIDPRGSIHATTGILAIVELQLPAQFWASVLAKMAVSFRIGPVLTAPSPIRVPAPVEQAGVWSWVWQPAPGTYQTGDVVAAGSEARLADSPPHLMEGWLMLSPPKPKNS